MTSRTFARLIEQPLYLWVGRILLGIGSALFLLGTKLSAQGFVQHEVTLQVDGSGSMTGFQRTGQLGRLIDQIVAVCRRSNLSYDVKFFVSNQPDQVIWLDQDSFFQHGWGTDTNLELAFDAGLGQSPIKVLLTDNVHDVGEGLEDYERGALALYRKFAQDTVKVLQAIPLRRPFSGKLPNPLQGRPNGLSDLYHLNPGTGIQMDKPGSDERILYVGNRGLILYIYLTNGRYRSSYNRLLVGLKTAEMEPLLLKPIDQNAIIVHPRLEPKKLVASLDQEIRIDYSFTLESKFSYVNIVTGDAKGPEVALSVQQPLVSPVWSGDRAFFGGSAKSRGMVTPPRLMETVKSNTQNSYIYSCNVLFGPFRMTSSGLDYLFLARGDNIPANYRFAISMTVPPDALQMTDDYRNRYFTDNPGVLDRIYSPVDIIHHLHTRPLSVMLGPIPGQFTVSPPIGPWVGWGVILVLIGSLVWYALRQFLSPLRYRIKDSVDQETEHQERLFLWPFARKSALVYFTSDGTELRFGHFARPRRSIFTFTPDEGACVEDQSGNLLAPQLEQKEDGSRSSDLSNRVSQGVEPLSSELSVAKNRRGVILEVEKEFVIKRADVQIILERIP